MSVNAIKYRSGDLFELIPQDERTVIIPHVVNNAGKFAKGFALAVAKHCPAAKSQYLNKAKYNALHLGEIDFVSGPVKDDYICYFVVNMVAQTLYEPRPLRYNALARCMDKVYDFVQGLKSEGEAVELHCPKFGAGLAGGDWNFVEKLIEDCWTRRGLSVTIYTFNER